MCFEVKNFRTEYVNKYQFKFSSSYRRLPKINNFLTQTAEHYLVTDIL